MTWLLSRLPLVLLVTGVAIVLGPFPGQVGLNAGAGVGLAGVVLAIERAVRDVPGTRVLGGVGGALAGLGLAGAVAGLVPAAQIADRRLLALYGGVLVALPYLGLMIGVRKSEWLDPARWAGVFRDASPKSRFKILDTSAIIDGRIAEVCEAGFLDGTLVVPQFVLWELQAVADSADSLKRNRGRRGLDILQKIQKMTWTEVQILDKDFPDVREVDLKLIELARELPGKIVTNDFNLNKVAQLRGVDVLNINELANALKPVVLPGEFMKVFILKEGKEYNQGVAYLDDGTMVVVDNSRRLIGQTIDVVVTSVLQTTAGKMIFGRYIEPGGPARSQPVGMPQKDEHVNRARA